MTIHLEHDYSSTVTYHYFNTLDGIEYRRYGDKLWDRLWGSTWEQVVNWAEEDQLEHSYRYWKSLNE